MKFRWFQTQISNSVALRFNWFEIQLTDKSSNFRVKGFEIQEMKLSKTKLFCETSFKNEALRLKNKAFLRDFLQKQKTFLQNFLQ